MEKYKSFIVTLQTLTLRLIMYVCFLIISTVIIRIITKILNNGYAYKKFVAFRALRQLQTFTLAYSQLEKLPSMRIKNTASGRMYMKCFVLHEYL